MLESQSNKVMWKSDWMGAYLYYKESLSEMFFWAETEGKKDKKELALWRLGCGAFQSKALRQQKEFGVSVEYKEYLEWSGAERHLGRVGEVSRIEEVEDLRSRECVK